MHLCGVLHTVCIGVLVVGCFSMDSIKSELGWQSINYEFNLMAM